MKCTEIMTAEPRFCVPEDNIAVAAGIMWDYDLGAIPVVSDMQSNELVGFITDRDMAMHVVKHSFRHPNEVKVSDCMSTNLITCGKEDALETAMKLMAENKIRRVPVVDDNGCCVGILSQTDILANSKGMEDAVIAMMQQICSKCDDKAEEKNLPVSVKEAK